MYQATSILTFSTSPVLRLTVAVGPHLRLLPAPGFKISYLSLPFSRVLFAVAHGFRNSLLPAHVTTTYSSICEVLLPEKKPMGIAPSMLTQYDIEEVQEHCNNLFTQQEIVSLYQRFCQLDRNAKGFISADEFLSVPEFALNPLSHRLLKMVDGLNFKDFVAFLSSFSAKASMLQKVELIFKVYDWDGNGKVTFNDILEVLHDLTGSFMSSKQREEVLTQVLEEAGYTRDSQLFLDDFIKVLANSDLKMDVEVPVD